MANDNASVATNATKKPRKSFVKSVKSVAKGLSLKRKKKRSDGDDESVLSVALENYGNSTATKLASQSNIIKSTPIAVTSTGGGSSSPAKPLQIFVLLLDPTSRRFELLQLEFDANKATVGDIQNQIKNSATEKTLRDMEYCGVCDRTGMEMIASMKLLRFCNGGDVVMAMPKGMNGNETAKLAKPILSDPKVENVASPSVLSVLSFIFDLGDLKLIAFISNVVDHRQLGTRKTNMQPKMAEKSNQVSGTKLPEIAEEGIRQKETNPPTSKMISEVKKSPVILTTAILGIIISSLLYFTIQYHFRVSTPLESRSVLLPGEWKSPCGLYDLLPRNLRTRLPVAILPPACDTLSSSALEFGSDGILRHFKEGSEGERKLVKSFSGSIGNGDQCSEESDQQCTENGALFVKDGYSWYVVMGEKRTLLSWDVMRDFTS